MTAQEVLNEYLTFLWMQFQYDWYWLSNPWLLIVGNLIYLFFFTVKWSVLLAPVTIPITILKCGLPPRKKKDLETYKRN